MDIYNKLQELSQEILSFGDVINYANNPADMDFRNACDLFSQHLNSQLNSISTIQNSKPDVQQTTAKLYQLSELITPDVDDCDGANQWSDKLLDFCKQLETFKAIAA